MIIYQSQTIYLLWNNMVDAVRSEEEMLKFMGLMNSSWLNGRNIMTAFDLSCFQRIVDLGGCTSALAREMTKAYPSSSVTVFDLPQVIETAQKHFSEENDTFVFQAADLYVLNHSMFRIIHDWSEEKCQILLKKIYDACKPGGGHAV
ncbi:hypothetical protein LDENG_00024420 [Lucifuga dentata]|nr:hypothetical protein LDENG_00024420 [Lucifuga dentata]